MVKKADQTLETTTCTYPPYSRPIILSNVCSRKKDLQCSIKMIVICEIILRLRSDLEFTVKIGFQAYYIHFKFKSFIPGMDRYLYFIFKYKLKNKEIS